MTLVVRSNLIKGRMKMLILFINLNA